MKGIIVEKPGADFKFEPNNIPKPKPGPDEILCKSLAAAFNPVDFYMQATGSFVEEFPAVLGCDASGVVEEVGAEAAKKWKKGDRVCGCTRVGDKGYTTFAEFFLMRMDLAIRVPEKLSNVQAGTIGVGAETALLGVVNGLNISLKDIENGNSAYKNEWAIVFGGSGSVGSSAVQFLKSAGFKVIASCSPENNELAKRYGADATFDYKTSVEDQIKYIKTETNSNFRIIFDSTTKSHDIAIALLEKHSQSNVSNEKLYATVDSLSKIETKTAKVYAIELGMVGKPEQKQVNEDVGLFVPVIERMLESGKLKPNEVYEIEGRFEKIIEGAKIVASGKQGGKKVVINLTE